MRQKQLKLRNNFDRKSQDPRLRIVHEFGGSLLKNSHAKTARAISTTRPMHLVLSTSENYGRFPLRKAAVLNKVNSIVQKLCDLYGIKLYEYSNNGNHMHLVIYFKNRYVFKPFIRRLTAQISYLICGGSKINALAEKLFTKRPWSRVVEWQRGYKAVKDYVLMNYLEATGQIPYQPRKSRYAHGIRISTA